MSAPAESVIHDLGYRRYTGARLGRAYAFRSLYLHSLRSSFGIGRGMKAKIFPWAVTGIIVMVAAIVAVMTSLLGERPMTYPEYVDGMAMLTILLVASAASEVITRDLGSGVMPLYLARPLSRLDYAFAKTGALFSAIVLALIPPQLLIFAAFAFSTEEGAGEIVREFGRFSSGATQAVLHGILIGSIGALAASLCRRRMFGAVAVVAVFLVTSPIAELLTLSSGRFGKLAGLISPTRTLSTVGLWLFPHGRETASYGPVYLVGLVVIALAATGGLLLRYRKV